MFGIIVKLWILCALIVTLLILRAPIVDEDGKPVDEDGKPLDEDGQPVDDKKNRR